MKNTDIELIEYIGRQRSLSRKYNMTQSITLFKRQRYLLTLLDLLGGKSGNLDFQKLLFLDSMILDESAYYQFIPYKFGAFSYTSYADRRKLMEKGFLKDEEEGWVLLESAKMEIDWKDRESIRERLGDLLKLRGDRLVEKCYRDFPYYAIHSEIAGRILYNDPEVMGRIEKARPGEYKQGLFTIGYEGHSLESYLNLLIQNGITHLCDVRKNPISRKYGFSKNTLKNSCEGVGIEYLHFPELGIESRERKNLNTLDDYKDLFKEYEKSVIPFVGESLKEIEQVIQNGARLALTCYEKSPEYCHRNSIASALYKNKDSDMKPMHL